jgi:arylsulfatase A-like enzyme
MVDYGYDPEYDNLWDNHNAPVQNHPKIWDVVKLPWHLAGVDQACAALLDDLRQRGLLERTLVVFLTDFGRTPRINREGGRDHWGAAGSLFFAGGGVRGGQVIGATDRRAANPVTPSWNPADVAASIYYVLGIDPETTLYDRLRRPLPVLPAGRVIAGMFAQGM